MKVQIIFTQGEEKGEKENENGGTGEEMGRGELLNYESVRNSKEEKEMKWKRRKMREVEKDGRGGRWREDGGLMTGGCI